MAAAAKAMTDAEICDAAEYFSSLKPKQIIKVVESDTVPKTYIARLFFAKREDGGNEPLGSRIVEFPNDVEQFELCDSRSQFTAYTAIVCRMSADSVLATQPAQVSDFIQTRFGHRT